MIWLSELEDQLSALPKPIRVLGNGSNTLIDDRGLKGTVILTKEDQLSEPELLRTWNDRSLVRVQAGFSLPRLAKWAARQGLSGCEFMVGVPGTLGGAVLQNAGANEQDTKDILEQVLIFDLDEARHFNLSAQDCDLRYRWSSLKEKNWVVLSADLILKKAAATETEAKTQLNLNYRKQQTPYARPSLGSTFTRIQKDGAWLYPGKLIEEAGLKGHRVGQVSVSEKHANYIINEGGGRFEEAYQLILEIEQRVLEHSGVKLEREVLIWSDLIN